MWNLRWILQIYLSWLIGVGSGERTLLLAKAKNSKNFYALRARFLDFAYEILRFAKSASISKWWILRNYLYWLIEVGKGKGILLLAKVKSSKNFTHFVRDSVSLVLFFARFYAERRISQGKGKGKDLHFVGDSAEL